MPLESVTTSSICARPRTECNNVTCSVPGEITIRQAQLPNAISTTSYSAANELTTWGTATPTSDPNGNVSSDGTNSYLWNPRNQFASMNSSADSFSYDPFGRRLGKTIVSSTTNYLDDGVNPAACRTAPHYRLYALEGTRPPKPGLARDDQFRGPGIEVEVWAIPENE